MIRILTWLLVGLSASAALGADSWVGKWVFWKSDAKAEIDGEEFDIERVPCPAKIDGVSGAWLIVGKARVRVTDAMQADEAFEHYSDRIERQPLDAFAWRNRAMLWRGKGELDSAIKDSSEAIRLNPKQAQSYEIRAWCWYAKRESGRAFRDCDEALRLDPKNWKAYNIRGLLREQEGDRDKSVQDFTEAIRLAPEDAFAYTSRARCFIAAGEYDKAIADYTQATRLAPSDPFAFESLARLLATSPIEDVRDGTKAVRLATTACELTAWKNQDGVNILAAAYAEAGDFKSAVRWQDRAIALATTDEAKAFGRQCRALYVSGNPYRERFPIPQKSASDGEITAGSMVLPAQFQSDTYVKAGDHTVCKLTDLAFPCVVERVKGDLILIGDSRFRGWVELKAVISLDDVIKACTQELQTNPSAVKYHERGSAWAMKRELGRALDDYSEAIRLDPTDATHFCARGGTRLANDELKNAIDDATEAIRLSSQDLKPSDRHSRIEALRLRAAAYERTGDKKAAEFDRREAEALQRSPSRPFLVK